MRKRNAGAADDAASDASPAASPPRTRAVSPAKKSASSSPTLFTSAMRGLACVVLLMLAFSRVTTDTFFFGYEMSHMRKLFSTAKKRIGVEQLREFTIEELRQYDGSDPEKPVYLAILGDVFDVSASQSNYRPGTGYSFFSGRDASRAYATGCFETHLTHDIRGLSKEEIESIKQWHSFYANSDKYFQVGTIKTPELDDSIPIPEPCKKN